MRIFKLYLPFELFDRIKLMAKFYNLSISKRFKLDSNSDWICDCWGKSFRLDSQFC